MQDTIIVSGRICVTLNYNDVTKPQPMRRGDERT